MEDLNYGERSRRRRTTLSLQSSKMIANRLQPPPPNALTNTRCCLDSTPHLSASTLPAPKTPTRTQQPLPYIACHMALRHLVTESGAEAMPLVFGQDDDAGFAVIVRRNPPDLDATAVEPNYSSGLETAFARDPGKEEVSICHELTWGGLRSNMCLGTAPPLPSSPRQNGKRWGTHDHEGGGAWGCCDRTQQYVRTQIPPALPSR